MISLNWVKDYVDIENEDLKELAVKITKAGVNVEKVFTNRIDNLVIGEVIECKDHPDSDHLHICQVDVGSYHTQIVCGAKNVRKGIKVIFYQEEIDSSQSQTFADEIEGVAVKLEPLSADYTDNLLNMAKTIASLKYE